MKTTTSFSVEATAVERLKNKAHSLDVPIGDLLELFIDLGLAKVPHERLVTWAGAKLSRKGRLGGGLRRDERAVLAAIEALHVDDPASHLFGAETIARKIGLRVAVAQDALNALVLRGMAKRYDLAPGEVDRWGRDVGSVWCLPAHEAEFQARRAAEHAVKLAAAQD